MPILSTLILASCAATAMAASSSPFARIDNMDLPSCNIIQTYKHQTHKQCERLCSVTRSCEAYTSFTASRHEQGVCHLKDQCTGAVFKPASKAYSAFKGDCASHAMRFPRGHYARCINSNGKSILSTLAKGQRRLSGSSRKASQMNAANNSGKTRHTEIVDISIGFTPLLPRTAIPKTMSLLKKANQVPATHEASTTVELSSPDTQPMQGFQQAPAAYSMDSFGQLVDHKPIFAALPQSQSKKPAFPALTKAESKKAERKVKAAVKQVSGVVKKVLAPVDVDQLRKSNSLPVVVLPAAKKSLASTKKAVKKLLVPGSEKQSQPKKPKMHKPAAQSKPAPSKPAHGQKLKVPAADATRKLAAPRLSKAQQLTQQKEAAKLLAHALKPVGKAVKQVKQPSLFA